MIEPVEDRDALYYPFIHFRDEAWLRNSLLFFPHVLRMVPAGYPLRDSRFVRELSDTVGRRGEPLVGSYDLGSGEAYAAGLRLAQRLAADIGDPEFCRRYDKAAASGLPAFHLHRNKFAVPLLETLSRQGLMWDAERDGTSRHGGDWLAVHPSIGEVMMSTAAQAVAASQGCDVLTDSSASHLAASACDEETIYRRLDAPASGRPQPVKPSAMEIGNLVIATTLDLSAMTPADYVALSQESEVLFDFRRLLAEKAATIAPAADHGSRLRRAKEAADAIATEWQERQRTFGKFFKRALRLEGASEGKQAATDILQSALYSIVASGGVVAATDAPPLPLVVLPGLAVGLTFYGFKTWQELGQEEQNSPTRFLSQALEHGATLVASSRPAQVG